MPANVWDPEVTALAPLYHEEYPYDKVTKAAEVAKPAGSSVLYTDQVYPRAFIDTNSLLKNLTNIQRDLLLLRYATTLVLVPFGAGPCHKSLHGEKTAHVIEAFL